MNKYLNPRNYWNRVLKIYYELFYDLEQMRKFERQKFDQLGFQYDEALQKLDKILRDLGKSDFASQKGMGSIHWLLFCSISNVSSIDNILEIGTYDGETTQLLSKIFPNSSITTIDLPHDDPLFLASYQRADSEKTRKFKEKQKSNLFNSRIRFLEKNSFFVPGLMNQKFDLIWIDGSHLYPEIAWDICNAYHLCNIGGWIMCDDVITDKEGFRDEYVSPDSYHVLEYMKKRTRDEIIYFLKRESPEWSADPKKRKFVAVIRKL